MATLAETRRIQEQALAEMRGESYNGPKRRKTRRDRDLEQDEKKQR